MKKIFKLKKKDFFAIFFLAVVLLLFSKNTQAAPYSQSSVISGISWDDSTLKRTAYGSDNFPTTWSNDDNIYTIWGDGAGFNATAEESGKEPYRAGLGVSRISGSPGSFSATNIFGGKNALNKDTFGGKAYGILSIDRTLYMLQGPEYSPAGDEAGGWDAATETTVGVSYNHGASWSRTGVILDKADGFCSPGFLNYGKDYAGARDNYVYIYGRDCSGMDGSTMYQTAKISLARVPRGSITNPSSYEFYSGTNGSEAWVSNSASRKPVFINNIGYPEPQSYDAPSAIYNSGLKRYILIVTHGTSGSPRGGLGIYDGPNPWGPWTTVTYDNSWMGSDHLFYANIPTKWISGNSFYLVFTGTNPDQIAEDAYQHMKGTFTLASTPVPAATLSLTADPTSRTGAGPSTLTWTTNNATSCWASGGASGDGWYESWKASTNGAHPLSVSVPSTRTYSMECWNSASVSSGKKNVTVTINAPSSCTLPWGGSIASGSSVTAYSASSVACGSSCTSQTRTCTNGVLSGTYTNQNCSVAACPANTPPSASIKTPSSDGTSVTKGSTLNFSGSIADSDSSSLTYGWYIDRIGDGFLEALVKQGTQTPGNTSGSITMTGTKTNIANPSQAISLDTVGATYNLILKVSDGTNTEVQTIRSFTLANSAPADFCGDGTCNGSETCSSCSGDCGACPPAAKTYNLTDFTNLAKDWLKSLSGSPADTNLDNKVNSKDLGIMMSNWAL